jgi:hypothetical protein
MAANGSVVISPPKGFFSSPTLVGLSGGNITVPLVDGVTGEGGAGTFSVVFVSNELTVFGSGTNGPALHVVKGIPPYNAMILRGWQFSVDATGKVIGAKDLRTYGGVSAGSLQPSALNAFKIQNAGDFSGTAPGAGTDGYVITWVESADAFELQPLSTVGFEIEHAADFGGTAPGAGNDGYVVTWSNTEHYFELLPAPGGSPLPITFGTAVPNPSAITETGQMYLRTNQATPAPDGIVFIAAGVYAEPETPTQLSHTPTQLLRFIETSGSVATDATANSHNGTFTNVGY